jgi:hypothetical protein
LLFRCGLAANARAHIWDEIKHERGRAAYHFLAFLGTKLSTFRSAALTERRLENRLDE